MTLPPSYFYLTLLTFHLTIGIKQVIRAYLKIYSHKMKKIKSIIHCFVHKLTYQKHNIYALFGRLKQF